LPQERAREKDVGSVGFEREDGARYGNACGDAPRWRCKKRGPDVFIIFSEMLTNCFILRALLIFAVLYIKRYNLQRICLKIIKLTSKRTKLMSKGTVIKLNKLCNKRHESKNLIII
jgi:hypothetical protein